MAQKRTPSKKPQTKAAAAAKATKAAAADQSPRADVYERITNAILAQLEAGTKPWEMPWQAGPHNAFRPLRQCGTPYKGINVLILWADAMQKGFNSPRWMTFKQAQELGAHVRKGEHGSYICYASTFKTENENEQGEMEEKNIPFMKGYTVFNVEQIEGLPAEYYPTPLEIEALPEEQRNQQAETFFENTGASVTFSGTAAYYRPSTDTINMPPFKLFKSAGDYYATLAHETIHWTKAEKRLDRSFSGQKRFAGEGYAMEELVAEIGAAFICAELGLEPEPREDHAAYIASWIKALKEDKRAIFTAASAAQKAADYLIALQSTASIQKAA